VISAREMSKKERRFFREEADKMPNLEARMPCGSFGERGFDGVSGLVESNTCVLSQPQAVLRMISIRLPESLLEGIKVLANRRDVPINRC